MDGEPLLSASFADLLPASIRSDAGVLAAAQSLDALLRLGDMQMGNVLIWARIDGLDEPLLSNLAYQLHLEGYEGWHLAETLEQKRRLVKDAVKLHFYKGTRWSLERIFELLDMRGEIVEWWESDEPPDAFPPYTFDINVQATRAIGDQFYVDVFNLIYALKNVRSHLRGFRLTLATQGRTPVVASALLSGLTITVHPFAPRAVALVADIPVVAGGMQTLHHMTVYPIPEDNT